jgi:hypothetical protein
VNYFNITCARQEVRAVERRALLETLANKLPEGTISYSSRVKSVKSLGKEGTALELEDGRQIVTKVTLPFGNRSCFMSQVLQKYCCVLIFFCG